MDVKILLATCCACVFCQVAQARIWTDAKGNKVKAELVGAGDGMVSLRKGDRTIKMPISDLSKSDQYFINLGLPSKKGNLRKPSVTVKAKSMVSREQYRQQSAKDAPQSKQTQQAKAKDTQRQVYSASDKANALMKQMMAARSARDAENNKVLRDRTSGFKKAPVKRLGST